MKLALKIVVGLVVVYALLVTAFETWLGYSQPRGEDNLLITYTGNDGAEQQRVLSLFQSQGELYLAANHWPRGWFTTVKQNPDVHIEFSGDRAGLTGDYLAVTIGDDDHDRVLQDNPLPLFARVLMGFPPREFVRLEQQ